MGEPGTDQERSRPAIAVEVACEVRWSFTRPWVWLRGVALNLLLALGYLVVVPLSGHHRGAWSIVIGSYFVNFILADVTSTNVFGPDRVRTAARLNNGESFCRLLLIKNLTLILLVGLPTLILTAALTGNEHKHSLAVTLPAVAFPLLCWIAFGDVVSVLLAIKPDTIRERWRHRRNRASTVPWLAHIAVPYGLFFLIQYLRHIEHGFNADVPHALGHTVATHGLGLLAFGLTIWAIGLALATAVVTHRGVRFR